MSGGSWLTVVAVLVVTVTTVYAAIPGPYDRRYPDYIVDPRVSCEKEGSFPHPRNCSWYYRCVDRMNVGIFWTYYFECEPGTVFSDDLDQCVHSHLVSAPCGTPPTTPRPIIPCTGVEGTCKNYEICDPLPKRTINLCDEIQCPLRTPNLQCGPGYGYDLVNKKCTLKPKDWQLCGYKEPVSELSLTEIAKLTCSSSNLRPKTDFVSRVHCDNYALCDGTKFKENKQLCSSYYECYYTGAEWKANLKACSTGLLFSYDLDQCVAAPSPAEICTSSNF
ncbi:uncharacterized protein [Procambarus clarkii]|uniref:uncharacterized protein n=1 Tax=Procambarus clarkii TaxID=6728 RepID=UPI001E6732E8|nr:uncharacterized protein LOC123770362 [Procambarus clarkii]